MLGRRSFRSVQPQPAVPEYYESDMSWALHLLLKAALERYGIVVKTTKETQSTTLGVYERGAASKGCDLFLSLHSNAVGSHIDETADHVMVAVVIAEYFDVPGPGVPIEPDVLYRVQAGAFRVRANAEAYLAEVRAAGIDAYITTQAVKEPPVEPEGYTLQQFITDVQTAVGAAADGIAGPETLRKVPTISRLVNSTHPAVIPLQKRLYALGYAQVGKADGIAGSGFEQAVKAFQTDNDGEADGAITAGGQTWRKLFELK